MLKIRLVIWHYNNRNTIICFVRVLFAKVSPDLWHLSISLYNLHVKFVRFRRFCSLNERWMLLDFPAASWGWSCRTCSRSSLCSNLRNILVRFILRYCIRIRWITDFTVLLLFKLPCREILEVCLQVCVWSHSIVCM